MAALDEENRRAANERAAQLRRENARRMKQRLAAARKAKEDEEAQIREALEKRRREKEAMRGLITAGARVRPTEVLFDDVQLPAPPSCSAGRSEVRRQPPYAQAKPGWDGGVGPSSGAVRVGFQPVSLVPPPMLPPKRTSPSAGTCTPTAPPARAPRDAGPGTARRRPMRPTGKSRRRRRSAVSASS